MGYQAHSTVWRAEGVILHIAARYCTADHAATQRPKLAKAVCSASSALHSWLERLVALWHNYETVSRDSPEPAFLQPQLCRYQWRPALAQLPAVHIAAVRNAAPLPPARRTNCRATPFHNDHMDSLTTVLQVLVASDPAGSWVP